MRILWCGMLAAALGAGSASAQTTTASPGEQRPAGANAQSTDEGARRPSLPTNLGDTGFWFVPTAETLPAGRASFSLYRSNVDRAQGLTDISNLNLTGAFGIGDRFEVFGTWGLVRLNRNTQPFFQTDDPSYGGVAADYPYLRRDWSKTLGGPVIVGGKYSLISQGRGDAMSLAPRVVFEIPTGSKWAGTGAAATRLELVASREFAKAIELSAVGGGVLRADPDEFKLSDSVSWGLGASFPSRSRLRGLVEWRGEWYTRSTIETTASFVAEDGSVAPHFSKLHDTAEFKAGAVWQATNGMFVHGGVGYTAGTSGRRIGLNDVQSGWDVDVRIGWHPGAKVYVPPPPPAPREVVREVVREVPAPAPALRPNANPVFSGANGLNGGITCEPCIVEPGQTSRLTATATDPDGDPLTYKWSAPQGRFSPDNTATTTWTAPAQIGNVPVTVLASDNRGGSAASTLTMQVVRKEVLVFEDVHFAFDRYNLRPEAVQILDDAVTKLQASPNVRITIEGNCDSIGTAEYNIALGERRATTVRDYLVNRGIGASRLRTVSFGEDRPIADNGTAQGRALNRRAHLVVIIETMQ